MSRPSSIVLALVACSFALSVAAGTTPSSSGRRSSGGHDFPTWEKDVSLGDLVPLAVGKPGHYVAAAAFDLGGAPVGVVALVGMFGAALQQGGVTFVDPEGALVAHVDGGPNTQPPIALGQSVVTVAKDSVSRVARDGVQWTHLCDAEVRIAPSAGPSGIACATADGRLELLDASTGDRRWSATLGSNATSMQVLREVVLAALSDGSVVSLDAAGGSELWRTSVGETTFSLVADGGAAWVAGRGRSNRSRDVAPVIARLPLREKGRRLGGDRDWRLRVGGDCVAAPMLLDDFVAFACHDGYVHAVERRKGVGGWRTDLPSHAWHAPILAGGRLDYVLDQSRYVVAVEADNGGVMGWAELSDEDEIFVGSAAWTANVTAAGTNLGRLVTLKWQWDPEDKDKEGGTDDNRSAVRNSLLGTTPKR